MKNEQKPNKKPTPFVEAMSPEAKKRQSAAIRSYYIKKREAQNQGKGKGKK